MRRLSPVRCLSRIASEPFPAARDFRVSGVQVPDVFEERVVSNQHGERSFAFKTPHALPTEAIVPPRRCRAPRQIASNRHTIVPLQTSQLLFDQCLNLASPKFPRTGSCPDMAVREAVFEGEPHRGAALEAAAMTSVETPDQITKWMAEIPQELKDQVRKLPFASPYHAPGAPTDEFCDSDAKEPTNELPTGAISIQPQFVYADMRTEGCSMMSSATPRHTGAVQKDVLPAEVCGGADAAAGIGAAPPSRKARTPRGMQRSSSVNMFDAIAPSERARRRTDSSICRKFSAAMQKESNGDILNEEDTGCVLRLFHASVPRLAASVKCVERVSNMASYSRWRSLAGAEGVLGTGDEAVFCAPPDLSLLPRLREGGLRSLPKALLEKGSTAVSGLRVFTHAADACREALASQWPQGSGGTYCICVSLLCVGAELALPSPSVGAEDAAVDNEAVKGGVVVRLDRLYLAYMMHFQFHAVNHRAALADRVAEMERLAMERQRVSKVHLSQYLVACRALLTSCLARLRCALDVEGTASEAKRLGRWSAGQVSSVLPAVRLVKLDNAGAEAEEVISLYLMGGGGVTSRPSSPQRGGEGAPVGPHSQGLRDVEVRRVENLWLFDAYVGQGVPADGSPRALASAGSPYDELLFFPRERSESPRRRRTSSGVSSLLGSVAETPPASPKLSGHDLTPRCRSSGVTSPPRAPRTREQLIWHGARLKREDVGSSLEDKLRSIAEQGLDPMRCVKGATAQGGIWAAISPLAAFGRSPIDGRIAFVLCAAKTHFNEWVDTSCVRVLSRERVLPLYILTHVT